MLNESYCKWCYSEGEYTYDNMDDLIEFCADHMVNEHFTAEQVQGIHERYAAQTQITGNDIQSLVANRNLINLKINSWMRHALHIEGMRR